MKSIWNGAISFGLVNIPVSLFTVEESNDLKFNYIDSRDENKVKYKRVNEVTGKEVPWENIVKAYKFEDGDYVVMTDEDFEKADPEASKTVAIETFIDTCELSMMYLEKPYYMTPSKGSEKPYVLLREALKKTGKIAIARVVIRTKEHLAVIYTKDEGLVLNLIRFYEDIRAMEQLKIPKTIKIIDKEMELAESLIEGMTEDWKPENYKDQFSQAIMKRIEAKSKKKGKAIDDEIEPEKETKETAGKVIDIMDLLKKSVKAYPKKSTK
ncbi:MAG: DNA end-binding protein Ku [Fusobacteria bacterium]|nr:MAG: DNA end-binding protein Ku [Fusobacteriota bacterium]KAF0229113.1 MAG: DNA end-binding protein [Fusobacteriota bacterium]